MAISTRRIGDVIACPLCTAEITVPDSDQLELPVSPETREPVVTNPVASKPVAEEPVLAEPDSPAPEPAEPQSVAQESAEPGFRTPDFLPGLSPPPPPRFAGLSPQPEAELFEPAEDEHDEQSDDAGFVLRRQAAADEELDLTAMVDVVFQLLIFFMVTASFSLQKSIEVPTPDQPRKGVSRALQPLEDLQDVAILVNIDDANRVTIDDEPLDDLSELPDLLRDRMRRDQKSELILTASRQSTHRTVITIVDAANAAGMQRIRMASGARGED